MEELNNSETGLAAPSLSQPFVYTLSSAFIIITIVTIIGNLLVCYAIVANRKLRRTPTNTFIFSLALSDLLTAVIAVTFDIDILLKASQKEVSERKSIEFNERLKQLSIDDKLYSAVRKGSINSYPYSV